jgi:antitoxin CcdA
MLKRTAKERRAVNLSIDGRFLEEAKELDINLSRAAEEGIAKAISAEKTRRWKEENAEAIRSWNEWVKENGLPLEKYRMF